VDSRTANYDIYYRSWTLAGGWAATERVTNFNNEVDFNPCLAVDDSLVHLAYEAREGGLYRAHAIYHVYRNAIGWSGRVDVDASPARSSFNPSLTVGADGLLHIVYERETSNTPNQHEKVVHKSWDGLLWSGRTGLSTDLSFSRNPVIAAGDDGTLHVVWQDGENVGGDIFYAQYDGLAWQLVPDQIVTGGTEAGMPSVSVDAAGDIHVVWVDNRHGQPELYYMSNDGSGWSGEARLTRAAGTSTLPCVATRGNGSVHVLWTDNRDGNPEIYFRATSEESGVPGSAGAPGALVSLSAPWPQPFIDEVRMKLSLGLAADIELNVYDVEGRVVKNLASGSRVAGVHDISWDGRNAAGGRVAPGVYFVSCSTALGQHARRVVVVR
jgi:hypothetical protein